MVSIQQRFVRTNDQLLGYAPARILEIELDRCLPPITAFDEKSRSYYQKAHCLIRLHTQPLGVVDLTFDKDELSPDEYIPDVWKAVHAQINEHLLEDGLQPVIELTPDGLPSFDTPLCIKEREQFLVNAPFVSIVVSTHDRTETLSTCLNSLLSSCYPQFEIVVVDNAPSTNATATLIQELSQSTPFIRYVREARPGLSWARNRGIVDARGKILVFTDDDVVVDPYWLVSLVKGFSVADDVVCVSGLVLPLELETPAQFLFEEYGGFNKGFAYRIFKPGKKSHYPEMPLYPYVPGRFGVGASMAFTSDFLYKVGGFDTALGGQGRSRTGQDIAMFLQVILEGYKIVYQPRALLYHLHRRDYAGLCKQIYYYGIGTTAFLTKVVLDNPLLLFNLMAKVPYGLFFILNSQSPKNKKRSKNYPQELIFLERKGMIYGPLAYILSRWELRRISRKPLIARIYAGESMKRDDPVSASQQSS